MPLITVMYKTRKRANITWHFTSKHESKADLLFFYIEELALLLERDAVLRNVVE